MIDGYMNLDIEICGILVSGQMGCWTLTDNRNRPLMSIISWQDLRAEKSNLYQKLLSADYEGVFDEQWFHASGLECRPGLPAIVLGSQLVRPNVSKSSVRFHSLISWIANSLVGETFSMHSTDAGSSGLFDIYTGDWIRRVLPRNLFDIQLPNVTNSFDCIGIANSFGIPVYIGVGDQQASLLGAGLDKNLVVNIGTGGQIAVIKAKNELDELQTRPYFGGQYIHTKTHMPSGRVINRLIETIWSVFGVNLSFSDLTNLDLKKIDKSPSFQLNEEICERLVIELSDQHGPTEIAMIILSILANTYAEAISKIPNMNYQKIVFAGGVGQKFTNISTFIARELNIEIKVAQVEETTLQGLAHLSCKINS
jgi:xylulokinase